MFGIGRSHPKPLNEAIRQGLVGTADDFEPTGTKRQGRPEYRTRREFFYKSQTIPEGFIFDVHSLPRFLRPWQPKNPAWWGPPLLHDWLLESGGVSLKTANNLYYCAMEDIGVSWHHRTIAYRGVEFARRFFPDRIRRVDPDNAELIERVTGHKPVNEMPHPGLRAIAHTALRSGGLMMLRSKGLPV